MTGWCVFECAPARVGRLFDRARDTATGSGGKRDHEVGEIKIKTKEKQTATEKDVYKSYKELTRFDGVTTNESAGGTTFGI